MTPGFNYKRDTKSNRQGDIYTPKGYDACQTPPEALAPLLPFVDPFYTIWEPAAGEGFLAEELKARGYRVIQSDILNDQNFFSYQPNRLWHCLITNPPYSIKYKWLARCYELGKPFALLMPVEMLGAKTAQKLFSLYGIEVIFPDGRVNFKMPNKGWDSSAQFPTCWYTWGLGIGRQLVFPEIKQEQLAQAELFPTNGKI